jgi:hypothetical protein
MEKIILSTQLKRYRHGEMSPMVFNLTPMVMLQRDPKGQTGANRPYPHMLIFFAWFVWEYRIELSV